MLEILRVLYRELHYQAIRRNPVLVNDEKRFKRAMRNVMSIKRGFTVTFLTFFFLGWFIASGMIFTDDKTVIASFAVILSFIPFIFSLYITSLQSSHILSMNIFGLLKILPVKTGSTYLSQLILIDSLPSISLVIPSVIVLVTKFPLAGLLLLIWTFVGMFLGHSIGLIIFSLFGSRMTFEKTRKQVFKNLIKIIAVLVFMIAFYLMNYLRDYITKNSENLAGYFERYVLAFPFSSSSIFNLHHSIILIIIYSVILIPLYILSANLAWKSVIAPKISYRKEMARNFKSGFGGAIPALVLKDLKLILRKSSMIVGFLIPLYFVFPQIFLALKTGHLPKEQTLALIFAISLFSVLGVDIILKAEGRDVDFLRTLPLAKRQFVLGKALAVSIFPAVSSAAILLIGMHFDPGSRYLFLYPILLPLCVFLLAMIVLFSYPSEDIGIPEINLKKTLMLFVLNGIFLGFVVLPVFVMPFANGLILSYTIAISSLIILLGFARRLG